MKTINLITHERVQVRLFPDNQPHVVISDVNPGDKLRVVCPIRSSLEMVQLLLVKNAIKHAGASISSLVIPYLMGARYDRIMQPGDSFDLEVVADLINGLECDSVNLFDVHSPVATALIRNSHNHNNSLLVKAYDQDNAVLIVPDKGAVPKAQEYAKWNPRISLLVYCEKERDADGRVSLKVIQPERCTGRNCVIIDDICDGGATFLAIADQIHPENLTLIVSHGIFSKGFRRLRDKFDNIITSDSYTLHDPHQVRTIHLGEIDSL